MAFRIIEVNHNSQAAKVVKDTVRRHARKSSALPVGVFGQSPAGWPMKSDTMGINPNQIPAAMAADAELGVSVPYCPETGMAIYADPATRRRHCEAHGWVDRNGSYGDPQKDGFKKYEHGYDNREETDDDYDGI